MNLEIMEEGEQARQWVDSQKTLAKESYPIGWDRVIAVGSS